MLNVKALHSLFLCGIMFALGDELWISIFNIYPSWLIGSRPILLHTTTKPFLITINPLFKGFCFFLGRFIISHS